MARSRASLSIQNKHTSIFFLDSLIEASMLTATCDTAICSNFKVNLMAKHHLTQSSSLWASWAKHPCWMLQLLPHCCWSAGCWQLCPLKRQPQSVLLGHLSLDNHTVRFCIICTEREANRLMISIRTQWTWSAQSMWWIEMRRKLNIHTPYWYTLISLGLSHTGTMCPSLPQFLQFIFAWENIHSILLSILVTHNMHMCTIININENSYQACQASFWV